MGGEWCGESLGATVLHPFSYCSSRRVAVGNIGSHVCEDVGYKKAVLHQIHQHSLLDSHHLIE